jgi:transcription termination/antitermination protein NusA
MKRPEDQLSLAIGRDGQNVRLAAKLTGWKIDIRGKSVAAPDVTEKNSEEVGTAEAKEETAASEVQAPASVVADTTETPVTKEETSPSEQTN